MAATIKGTPNTNARSPGRMSSTFMFDPPRAAASFGRWRGSTVGRSGTPDKHPRSLQEQGDLRALLDLGTRRRVLGPHPFARAVVLDVRGQADRGQLLAGRLDGLAHHVGDLHHLRALAH